MPLEPPLGPPSERLPTAQGTGSLEPPWILIPCVPGSTLHVSMGPHFMCLWVHTSCVYGSTLHVSLGPHSMCLWVHTPCVPGSTLHVSLGPHSMCLWVHTSCVYGSTLHVSMGSHSLCLWVHTPCVYGSTLHVSMGPPLGHSACPWIRPRVPGSAAPQRVLIRGTWEINNGCTRTCSSIRCTMLVSAVYSRARPTHGPRDARAERVCCRDPDASFLLDASCVPSCVNQQPLRPASMHCRIHPFVSRTKVSCIPLRLAPFSIVPRSHKNNAW